MSLAANGGGRERISQFTLSDLRTFCIYVNISTAGCADKDDVIHKIQEAYAPGGRQWGKEVPALGITKRTFEWRMRHNQQTGSTSQHRHLRNQSGNGRQDHGQSQSQTRTNTTSTERTPQARASHRDECPPQHTPLVELCSIHNEDMIKGLKIANLRYLLRQHGVDMKGIKEKELLVEKVTILWKSAKEDKEKADDVGGDGDDYYLCKICLDSRSNVLLRPCHHLVMCHECCNMVSECPICREWIAERIRVYVA
eukprot:Clim_evm25s191 gene=Clim_evmTU25s191